MKKVTAEELYNMVTQRNISFLKFLKLGTLDFSLITEESLIDCIKKEVSNKLKFVFFTDFLLENKLMTSKIALEILKKSCFISKELETILEEPERVNFIIWYIEESEKTGGRNLFPLSENFILTSEQWDTLLEKNVDLVNFMKPYQNIPLKAIKKFMEQDDTSLEVISKLKTVTKSEIEYWLSLYESTYFNEYNYGEDFRMKEVLAKLKNFPKVLKEKPSLISWYSNPLKKLWKAVIDSNIDNLQYISDITIEIEKYALKKNFEIASEYIKKNDLQILKDVGITENQYKDNEYFLAVFDEDLCDESNVVKICVIEKAHLKDFLKCKYTVSFGNLYDDTPRYVKDYVKIKPITKDEFNTLKKLDLINIQSGYFSFED